MKRLIICVITIMAISIAMTQNKDKYNSVCFYMPMSAETYVNSHIDSITFEIGESDTIYQTIWMNNAGESIAASKIDSIYFYNPYVEGILEIEQDIDFWEKAWVTPIGYFCYKSSLPYESDDVESNMYEMLSFVDFEKSQRACIVVSKDSHLPMWFVVDSLYCYFNYCDETKCMVSVGNDKSIIGESDFVYDAAIVCSDNEYSENSLKRMIWVLTSLLCGNMDEYATISELLNKFKLLLSNNREEEISEAEKYPKYNDAFTFTSHLYSQKFIVGEIYYTVVMMTGGAYNIDATSADLEGSVRCAGPYRNVGTYGIICDKDPDNLNLETAGYNVKGNQDKLSLSFNVGVSNLECDTKYYYRAYYRKTGKSDIVYRYGEDIAVNATYGPVKSFNTLSPSVYTGDAFDISDKSAIVKCRYTNVPSGAECGVIVSTDDKIYEVTANNHDGECEIALMGLSAVTTYNYQAYIRIGEKLITGDVKQFTTSVPDISGTWKCTEMHYNVKGDPYYETYSITLQQDGSVKTSKSTASIVSGSWFLDASGGVSISVVYIATNTMTSGEDWIGTIEDMNNPTKITGYRRNWNYNQNGSFTGEPTGIVMTR